MREIEKTYYDFLNWYAVKDFGMYEIILLLALILSLVAFFMANKAFKRAVFPKYAGKTKSLERKVDSQEYRIINEVGQFEKDKHRLTTEHTELREKYNLLERKLDHIAKHLGLSLDEELFPEIREAREKTGDPQESSQVIKKKSEQEAQVVRQELAESKEDLKLDAGLVKTRSTFFSKLKDFFGSKSQISTEVYAGLEELLITSDLGVQTTEKLLSRLSEEIAEFKNLEARDLVSFLRANIEEILDHSTNPEIVAEKREGKPLVLLVVGVNGVGKTTTIAKLSAKFKSQGAKVLLGACDTFRAAASEQLEHWAEKVGVDIVVGEENAKPSTVAYKTIHKGLDENYDVVIIDTAGRLHTKTNLMNELENVVKIISREQESAPHESILILDATTGQNALQQAREFSKIVNLTGIVVTKLDGTPKGGIVVAIKDELGIPIRYLGIGEKAEDLKKFSAQEFVTGLLGDGIEGFVSEGGFVAKDEDEKKQAKRKRRASA